MRLNHPGIYRIVGEKFELLANIEGEAPLLNINEALLVNDLVIDGKFTILNSESLEIQQVINNPDQFIFIEYEYSDIAKLPLYRKTIRGTKVPNITNNEMKEFEEKYIHDMKTRRDTTRTRAYIMERTNLSLSQINVLIMQMARKFRNL
jgi:hypothetical protein